MECINIAIVMLMSKSLVDSVTELVKAIKTQE